WDDWTNLVQNCVKALFFFHPAVWWIDRRLVLEREMACDDMVLACTPDSHLYAASLVSLAERLFAKKMGLDRALVLAQHALGRFPQISTRLRRILDGHRPPSNRNSRPALSLVAGLIVTVFVALPYSPRIVDFEKTPVISASLPQASPAFNLQFVPKHPPGEDHVSSYSRPQIISASARWSRKRLPAAQARRTNFKGQGTAEMLVVVETRETYEAGGAVWRLCVWRIRAGNSAGQNVEEGILLNAI
ncbi:MAG: M56 family metallopeptidase, partial [Acidobacteria bacterium]|nr:M56 family metallopeptidase [Acidobacteriota bacterium]